MEGCFDRFWITQLALKVVAKAQAVPVCWFCCQPMFRPSGWSNFSPTGRAIPLGVLRWSPAGRPGQCHPAWGLLHSQPRLLQHASHSANPEGWSEARQGLAATPSSFWKEWAAAAPVPGHWVRLALAVVTVALGDKEGSNPQVVASWTIPRPLNQECHSIWQCRHSWSWQSPAATSILGLRYIDTAAF